MTDLATVDSRVKLCVEAHKKQAAACAVVIKEAEDAIDHLERCGTLSTNTLDPLVRELFAGMPSCSHVHTALVCAGRVFATVSVRDMHVAYYAQQSADD